MLMITHLSEISEASFPTPDLALRTHDPLTRARVAGFAREQARAARMIARALADELIEVDNPTAAMDTAYQRAVRWRARLAMRQGGKPKHGQPGIPAGADRFLTPISDGGANYDRIGVFGRLTQSPRWDATAHAYVGGLPTPASAVMAAIGQAARERMDREGAEDTLQNIVILPDGRRVRGNRLVRGAAARAISEDLVARIAARGLDTSQVETGGELLYAVTASDLDRDVMRGAAFTLLGKLSQDLRDWATASYLLYQAPLMKKGSDAVARVFLVATGAVVLGYAPRLPHDIDLRAYVLPQAQCVDELVAAVEASR